MKQGVPLEKAEKFFKKLLLAIIKPFIEKKNISPDSINHRSIKNILIIHRHQIGDIICATPMMRALRNSYPDAHITLVTKAASRFEEIFTGENKIADDVKKYEFGLENFIVLIRALRLRRYDLAVISSTITFSATNHLIAYYSNAYIRVGVSSIDSTDNPVDFLLNVKRDFLWDSKKTHQVERNLDIIKQIGIKPSENRIRIALGKDMEIFAEDFFKQNFPDKTRPVIGLHPGARKPNNVWQTSRFKELAIKLKEKFNPYIFISEGPSDFRYVSDLIIPLRNQYNPDDVIKYRGSLIKELSLINRLDLFITNDTGIMHLASGCKTPMIVLFGETKGYEWGPVGENKISIQSRTLHIDDISADEVFSQCLKLLKYKFSGC